MDDGVNIFVISVVVLVSVDDTYFSIGIGVLSKGLLENFFFHVDHVEAVRDVNPTAFTAGNFVIEVSSANENDVLGHCEVDYSSKEKTISERTPVVEADN